MNDLDHDAGLERRLEEYYDHAPLPPASDATWARIASHLAAHQADGTVTEIARGQLEAVDNLAEMHSRPQPKSLGGQERRSPVWAAAGALVAAVLLVALAGALFAELGRQRSVQPSPAATPHASATPAIRADIPAGTELEAITMTSPDTGWAVGYVNGAGLILQYSQLQWRTAASGFTRYKLDTIVMASPDEGWAEGRPIEGGTGQILLHYTEGRWQRMSLPAELPARTALGQLAMYHGSGWVVAYVKTDSMKNSIYALYHYADSAWSQIPTPAGLTIFGSEITPSLDSDVISFGQDDAWVIASKFSYGGDNFVAHYHAGQWTTWPLPADWGVSQLTMTSPTDGWAEGRIQGPSNTVIDESPLFLHFDGHTWTHIDIPANASLKYGHLSGAADGWAFAMTPSPGTSVEQPTHIWTTAGAYHFQQGAWQRVAWPYTGATSLGVLSLMRVSNDEYWGIAYRENPAQGQAGSFLLHYVHGTWSAYGPN